jgi:thiol-disulfide isomerase/thioredoxin
MKKVFFLTTLLFLNTFSFAQKNKKNNEASLDNVILTCTMENCSAADSLSLWRTDGYFNTILQFAKPDAQGKYTFQIPHSTIPQLYFVGLNDKPENFKAVLLGTEKDVTLTGPCYSPNLGEAKGSKVNADYDETRRKMGILKLDMNKVVQKYQLNYNDEKLRKEAESEMLILDKKKVALLDSVKKINPFVGKILALDTYTSFQQSLNKGKFKDEIEYFATQYFQYAKLSDPDYNNIPSIYELTRNYVQVILMPQLGLKKEQQIGYLNAILNMFPAKSQATKYALSGFFSKMQEYQSPLFITYAEKYLADYPEETPNNKAMLSMYINQVKAQFLEVPAPEIAQTDTSGKMLKLSEMKGKVVLVDFWASWCGPCRRENPNVVRLYNKYKTKGFDILSVSLDQDRDRWIKAINDDGLLWPSHVSDLKFWQNEAAKTYGVQSIPSTILVDKDGVIIARNLRGEQLENRLKQIFGE